MIPKKAIAKMKDEIGVILSGYRGNYISKLSIEMMLLENPSEFIKSLSKQRRRLLITLAILQTGAWGPWSGAKNREIRAFVRVK